MFTGIIETMGNVQSIVKEQGNVHFTISSPISSELKIDQSVAHNGVCLTVTELGDNWHKVTAISETLLKTNLGKWKEKDAINLERCMPATGRFDGHIVQGHVDQTGICTNVEEDNGSWRYFFSYQDDGHNVTVPKGSICINGVSLTVVDSVENTFSVAIIPYTYEHTNFKHLKAGDVVNLEFDIIGKYLARMLANYKLKS